jgi:sulfur relay (sulfurtransferase) complex TusBCD TusD component (DsrE family)
VDSLANIRLDVLAASGGRTMAKYLLIESRDPFDSADVQNLYELADGLAEQADELTVYLVQNGVLPTRRGSAAAPQLATLARKANVLADDFSLRERGIPEADLATGVRTAGIDDLVELVAENGRKVLWH